MGFRSNSCQVVTWGILPKEDGLFWATGDNLIYFITSILQNSSLILTRGLGKKEREGLHVNGGHLFALIRNHRNNKVY